LEKSEFKLEELIALGSETDTPLVKANPYFHNDIFRKFWVTLTEDIMKVQSDLIYPAPQFLIDKYSS